MIQNVMSAIVIMWAGSMVFVGVCLLKIIFELEELRRRK